MVLISHRGNLWKKNPEKENTPDYINAALAQGFDVEVDVWFKNERLFLGHDKPETQINEVYLENNKLWCHAKNIEALEVMLTNQNIHCFFHQNDDVTVTSRGFIWTFPGKLLTPISICVLPKDNEKVAGCYGICSDNIYNYRK